MCAHACARAHVLGIPGLGLAMPQPILCASASLELFLKIEVTASETFPMSPGKWAPDPRELLSDQGRSSSPNSPPLWEAGKFS